MKSVKHKAWLHVLAGSVEEVVSVESSSIYRVKNRTRTRRERRRQGANGDKGRQQSFWEAPEECREKEVAAANRYRHHNYHHF